MINMSWLTWAAAVVNLFFIYLVFSFFTTLFMPWCYSLSSNKHLHLLKKILISHSSRNPSWRNEQQILPINHKSTVVRITYKRLFLPKQTMLNVKDCPSVLFRLRSIMNMPPFIKFSWGVLCMAIRNAIVYIWAC